LYADEQGFRIEEPTHCTEPNGRRTRLNRDTPGFSYATSAIRAE
jgi:hypothetical protein